MKICKGLLEKYNIKYDKDAESDNIEKSLDTIEKELFDVKEIF